MDYKTEQNYEIQNDDENQDQNQDENYDFQDQEQLDEDLQYNEQVDAEEIADITAEANETDESALMEEPIKEQIEIEGA